MDHGRLLCMPDSVLGRLFEAVPGSVQCLANSCKRLNTLARQLCVQRLHLKNGTYRGYQQAVSHAAQQMPGIHAVVLEGNWQFMQDEVVPYITLSLKQLPGLRHLTISTTRSFTALDVLALGELSALTTLQLQLTAEQERSSSNAASTASELQPLTRLTALQQLEIEGWQPLGVWEPSMQLPAGAPAAAGTSCFPASGNFTSLVFKGFKAQGLVNWTPHIVSATSLKHLELLGYRSTWDATLATDLVMNGIAEHLTGLTTLQMLAAADDEDEDEDGKQYLVWEPSMHILSGLQQLQQLQFQCETPFTNTDACMRFDFSNLSQCTALRELGEIIFDNLGLADGVVFPHLTRLGTQATAAMMWPSAAFPCLVSCHLIVSADDLPHHPSDFPAGEQLTELILDVYCADERPELSHVSSIARCLPALSSMHLALDTDLAKTSAEDGVARGWLESMAHFTQLQQLSITVPISHMGKPQLKPLVLQHESLRALCKLQQLQRLALSGWAWEVSPCFVVGLEVGLLQLQHVKLKGCWGIYDLAMKQVAAGLRPGLMLEWAH